MGTKLIKEFPTEENRVTEKYLKKYSTFLVTREIQIKTILELYLTPAEWLRSKN